MAMRNEVAFLILLSLGALAGASRAATPAQHVQVPLSDPAKPAHLKVSLVMGSITVEGAAVNAVDIAVSGRDEDEDSDGAPDAPAIAIVGGSHRERERSHEGLRRLPNLGGGIDAVEENNVVTVSSRAVTHPLDLRIQVPAGSSITLSTVNDGQVTVKNVTGELELHNTNGDVTAEGVRGPVTASTVNGDVRVVFAGPVASEPMAFSTLNGDVDVSFPPDLKATVRLRSDNGDLYSDFEIALDSRAGAVEEQRDGRRHRLELGRDLVGRINGGGPEILFKTFNGDVMLRKLKP